MALQIKIEATGLSKIDEAVKRLNSSFKELKNTLRNIESDGMNQLTKTLPKTADNLIKMDRESRKVNNSYYQMGQRMQEAGRRMDYLGSKMLPISIALGGLVTGAIKSGLAFESSFAGITKTINMSAFETQQLRGKMIELSKTIPVSVNELNKIGELGGQLGIGSKDIVAFTDTIAKLGVATNLTTEEGSLMLAQFMNVMKLDDSQIATLGSTIVELGNNFATTEKDITSMASRLSATTSVMGISSADTLGFATAMSSLGISAEEGGSALGRVLIKFNDYATQGGKAAAKLGKVAGMTGEAFSNLWKEDKTKAMQKLIQGLGEMSEKGQDILPVMEELGIKNTRDRTTVLKLASGYRTLNSALKTSNAEWGSTDALSKEAGNRFETLESQIELLKNNIVALAIKMYDELRPTLVNVVKNVNNFVNSLKDINPKVLTGLVGFMGLIATVGPTLKIINIPMQLFGGLLKKVGVEGTTATGIFKGMNPQIFSFGKAIKDGATTTGSFTTKLKAIGSNILGLVNPMTLAVTGLALLAGGIYTVYKKSNEEQKRLNALGEESKTKYENIMAGYTETTKSNIDEMTTAFVDFGTNLQLAGTGTDYFNLTDLTKNFQSSLDRMKTAYNTTMQGIIKAKTEGVSTSKYLSEQEKKNYIKSVSEQYSGHEKEASVIFAKIQKVYDNASKNGRDLSEKDLKKIQGFYDDLQAKVKGLDLTPPTEADNLLKQMSLGRKLTDEQKKLVESSISDTYWEQLAQLKATNEQGILSDKKYNSKKIKLLKDTKKQTAQLYGENVDDVKIMNGKIFTDTEGSYKKTSKFLKAMGVDLSEIPNGFVEAWGTNADKAAKLYQEGMKKGLTGPDLSQYVNKGMDLLQTNLAGKWSMVGEGATKLYHEGAKKGLMGNELVKYVETELSKIPTATAETSKANGQEAIRQYTQGMTLGEALGGIGTWFNNMWSGLKVNSALLMAKAGETLGNFWQGIVNFDLLGKINTWITNTVTNITLPLLNAWNKGKQLVSNLWKAFTDFNLLGKINTWITNTIAKFTLPLIQMWNKGRQLIDKMWVAIRDYNLLGKINTWITNTIAKFTLPLVQMWNKGKKIVSNMWQGFKDYDLLGKINNWFTTKLTKITLPIKNLIQLGKDIVEGIANGIGQFDLRSAISSLVGKIPDWARKVLNVNSPSKVMRDRVGMPISEGIAVGMTRDMKGIQQATVTLAKQTEEYMKTSFSRMQLEDLSNALDIQPNLTRNDKDKLRAYYKDLVNEIETQQLIIDTKFNKDVSTNLQTSKQPNSLSNGGVSTDRSVNVDTVNITTNKLDRKELELELKKLSKESGK